MANQLIFRSRTLEAIEHEGQPWFTAATLAIALEYSRGDKISQIYNRNADEFTPCMSINLKLRFNGLNNSLREKAVRVFSLRGAHLIAMFASTPVAKEFRKWVLDLIDKEVAREANPPSTPAKTDIKRRGPYAKKHADLPAGVYHCQSKYNPYRATAWDGKTSVYVGSYPTVDDAVQAIDHFHKTGVVQRLQAKRLTQSIEVTPLLNAKNTYPVDKTDFVNHLKTILEAAQLLSCYEHGKELAWDLVAFSQEEAQRFTQPA